MIAPVATDGPRFRVQGGRIGRRAPLLLLRLLTKPSTGLIAAPGRSRNDTYGGLRTSLARGSSHAPPGLGGLG
jgi:hypothetical protein